MADVQAPHPDVELAHGTVHDGDPIVAPVEHPDVTELPPGVAADSGGPVAIDRVVVQVEGHVVGTDLESEVGAVGEVVVEGRVGGDRVAALRLASDGPGASCCP